MEMDTLQAQTVVVSACLLGERCRYDGGSKPCEAVRELCRAAGRVIVVCPEHESGLPVPRDPAEQRDGRVFLASGQDVTEAFERGARICLERALGQGEKPALALLKAKSPSCGVGEVYDGSFTGRLTSGDGVFARLLKDAGVPVITEADV